MYPIIKNVPIAKNIPNCKNQCHCQFIKKHLFSVKCIKRKNKEKQANSCPFVNKKTFGRI